MDNLGWGLQISAVGMALVFALLAMLWGLLNLVLKLDRPPAAPLPASAAAPGLAASAPTRAPHGERGTDPATDPALRAAITVALLAHRGFLRGAAAPQVRQHPPGQLHLSRWVAAGRARQTHSWQRGR